jgi:hypothetical protein
VVADRHRLVCNLWAQVIEPGERGQATERIPQAGEQGKVSYLLLSALAETSNLTIS